MQTKLLKCMVGIKRKEKIKNRYLPFSGKNQKFKQRSPKNEMEVGWALGQIEG